jgi:general secretion pathway protein K
MKIPICDSRGAVALVLVLWVVVVLIVIAGQFAYSMRTEINIVRNFKEEEESYQLAMAGIEKAKLEILLAGPSPLIYLDEDGMLIFHDKSKEGEDGMLISNDGSEEVEKPVRSGTLGKGRYEYTIVDEDRKLNINTASIGQLKSLFHNTGVEMSDVDIIVDSMLDWRDTNDLHMLNGAEEDYYRSLEEPYSSKDGLFDTIEELMLVRGMTRDILYGTGKENTEDRKLEGDDTDVFTGVAEYLTAADVKKLNINTAHYLVLESVLGVKLAESISEQRETEPYKRPMSNNNQVSASHYTIISTGQSEDGKIKRTIKAIVKKQGKKLENLYWNDNFIG